VIFFSRSEDYILSARQSSAALYADNSADKMSGSVRVGPWQKNRYHQKKSWDHWWSCKNIPAHRKNKV